MAIDKQLASAIENGDVEDLTLPQLVRISGSLRRQLHGLKVQVTDPLLEPARSPSAGEQKPARASASPKTVPVYGADTPPPGPEQGSHLQAKPEISGF